MGKHDKPFENAHPQFREMMDKLLGADKDTVRQQMQQHSQNVAAAKRQLTKWIKAMPKHAVIQLDDYENRVAVSHTYGRYPRSKPVLDVSLHDGSSLRKDEFVEVVRDSLPLLALRVPSVLWSASLLPIREQNGSPIIRILAFAITKAKALMLVKDQAPHPVLNPEDLGISALYYVASELAALIEEDDVPTSYPQLIDIKEMRDIDPESLVAGKEVAIEFRYAGKDLVERGFAAYIKDKSQSPIESRFASALVLQGLLPIMQLEIPDPDYDDIISRPDIVIVTEPAPLLVYADGAKYHGSKDAQTHDKRVDRRLQELGFEVLRVSGSDIYSNIERVVEDVKGRLFGSGARILPEEFWIPKIQSMLSEATKPSDLDFLEDMQGKIKAHRRVTVKQEKYLNAIANRLSVGRTYGWLDDLFSSNSIP